MLKKWNFLCDNLKSEDIASLTDKAGISQIAAVVMLNRGIGADGGKDYLNPNRDMLLDPFLMKDMGKAVDTINGVLEKGGKITVYGDYDIDGVSSVTMLVRFLRKCGGKAEGYIPDRESEGYGLNRDALKKIKDDGTSLVITVDNGISAIEEAQYAESIGLQMVITDHHTCGDIIPSAAAVVNPKRRDCEYPFKELAGAGVCFKLISALSGDQNAMLDMFGEYVALATIADVVPLTNENRVLAGIGIEKMRSADIGWLRALCDVSKIEKEKLDSYNIGFMLAPRINAAGRIGTAYDALSLFMSNNYEEALPFAQKLDSENIRRKEIGNNIYEEALSIAQRPGYENKKVWVLAKENWHPGIIGISASRLADTYNKNVFLLSLSDGEAKGSGRGVRGFNLFDALKNCKDLLLKYGGHELAAGVSLSEENIEEFDSRINEYADRVLSEGDMVSCVDIDCRLSCRGSLLRLFNELQKFEPFGTGNPKPVFAVIDAKVITVKQSRDGKHLLLTFEKNGNRFSAIGFSMGDMAEAVSSAEKISIAALLDKNEFMGKVSPQFKILDMKM
ncbi:MAG: single-stranded-DNA-specific exonuclease RecJ [Clostridia bacterium]|nr:single-stranded-DNA-specific exonuclease RecJ [Clostridia bacterium]